MRLPPELQQAIHQVAGSADAAALQRAARELSERYRASQYASPILATDAHRVAYLQARLPGTYAATHAALRAVRELIRESQPASLLDLGAGPGTASWAALDVFPSLQQVTAVERDGGLIALGRRPAASHAVLANAAWIQADLAGYTPEPHDLVAFSYALGELAPLAAEQLITRAWEATRSLLVVIEAGTPRGFGIVHRVRGLLLAAGAHPIAPCPHEGVCPMFAGGDWCHFSARLERTSEHRRLKGGSLGHEDEKFSYFAAGKRPAELPDSRILRHPLVRPGHIQLTLCRPATLELRTITKSQKQAWRQARRARWGDAWPERG